MKKILVESCNDCPDSHACNQIFRDCPLPDEPEKVKGILEINTYEDEYNWVIELSPEVELFSYDEFETEEEARAEAMEWAKKLNVEVEE